MKTKIISNVQTAQNERFENNAKFVFPICWAFFHLRYAFIEGCENGKSDFLIFLAVTILNKIYSISIRSLVHDGSAHATILYFFLKIGFPKVMRKLALPLI